MPEGLRVKAIAAPDSSSVAVAADGTVWEWGGTSSVPVRVSGLTGGTAVAPGALGLNAALKEDGTVWQGQAGTAAAQVSGLNDVTAVAASSHRLALKRDGTVWAWGPNVYGQLGNGTTSGAEYEFSPPVQASGLTT